MELTLIVTNFNHRPTDSSLSYTWSERGGTIGRSLNNDWVLPDSQCYLSGQHAIIEYKSGEFFIVDTSTNGVFINHSSRPLGRGNRLRLQQGDQLCCGLYELQVSITKNKSNVDYQSDSSINSNLLESQDDQGVLHHIHSSHNPDPFEFLNEAVDVHNVISKQASKPVSSAHIANQACYLPELIQPSLLKQTPTELPAAELIINTLPDGWLTESAERVDQMPISPIPKKQDIILDNDLKLDSVGISELKKEKITLDTIVDTKQAFLKGLSLNHLDQKIQLVSIEDWTSLGLLLRFAVQGTLDILQSRAEIKNAMHMELTTIQQRNNNPLKFSLSVDEALEKLLSNSSEVYLRPEQAMAEAYEDIRAHQLAVIAGMQSALQQILKRFEPEKLIKRLEKENPISASIPLQRQAKLWGLFEELYVALEQECTDDFQRLFGLEFSHAYEAQIAQLKRGS